MPEQFVELRFPEDISEGATGGPRFNTSVFLADSGHEQRNANWVKARAEYDVAHGIRDHADMEQVIAFFYNMKGKAIGFRYKDWGDYMLLRSKIGEGDGSEVAFQIVKNYTIGSLNYARELYKIVSGTVTVWVDGIEQTSGYSVNNDTGLITFDTAPGNELDIEVRCEFDVPVRFDIDALPVTLEAWQLESVSGILLKEIRPR